MPATYAGQPLLLEDPDGKFAGWLDWALGLQSDDLDSDPISRVEGRDHPRSDFLAYVGLPLFNYGRRPDIPINCLWIPTGAVRWSIGLFLIDKKHLDKLALDSDGGADLKLGDGLSGSSDWAALTFRLYPLPPRRICGEGDTEVYVLPLVDRRWFWQTANVGDMIITEETTWDDILDDLCNRSASTSADSGTTYSWVFESSTWQTSVEAISDSTPSPASPTSSGAFSCGSFSHDEVPAAYAQPDPIELTRQYENLAMLLDAVAASLGMRCVFDPTDESLTMMSATTSETILVKNLADSKARLLAGGEAGEPGRHEIPASVTVAFPKAQAGEPQANGDLYVVTKSASTYMPSTATQPSGTVKTFFDTALAEYVDTSGPTNSSTLDDLADQIASDYYAHLGWNHDVAYAGLVDWTLSGFDDWVLYRFAESREEGYRCTTRATSVPYNFGVEELLHQVGYGESSSSSSSSSSSGSSTSTASHSSGSESSRSSSSSSSSSSHTESESSLSSSSSSTQISTESSSSSSQISSESSSSSFSSVSSGQSSTSASTVLRLVRDVCCDKNNDLIVCYTDLYLRYVPSHLGYVISWVAEDPCEDCAEPG